MDSTFAVAAEVERKGSLSDQQMQNEQAETSLKKNQTAKVSS